MSGGHPSKSDFQATPGAIQQQCPIEPEVWEKTADDAVAVILDPKTTQRLKLGALQFLTDAAAHGSSDVEASLKRVLGRDRQKGRAENDPLSGDCT
ncbi:MAG TPA: hypothetical protein VFG04_08905 [Planctomycetaceae bacterium]|jgi:hypothetical protein|nr:hypothetical protein [Planctomycetaceae bacterium]